MGTWNENTNRRRRVIGEMAGPVQDEVMQGFNASGFGGAVAVQDGHVAGGNVGTRMPDSNVPTNRARVVYYDPADPRGGMSTEGRGRALAVPARGDSMATFLDPNVAADRARRETGYMRVPMSPGRRAIMDNRENRSNNMADSALERQLRVISATPVSFEDGSGFANGKYYQPTPEEKDIQFGKAGDRAYLPNGSTQDIPNAPMNVGAEDSIYDETGFNQAPAAADRPMIFPDGSAVREPSGEITENQFAKRASEKDFYPVPEGLPPLYRDESSKALMQWDGRVGYYVPHIDDRREEIMYPGSQMELRKVSGAEARPLRAEERERMAAWLKSRAGGGGAPAASSGRRTLD